LRVTSSAFGLGLLLAVSSFSPSPAWAQKIIHIKHGAASVIINPVRVHKFGRITRGRFLHKRGFYKRHIPHVRFLHKRDFSRRHDRHMNLFHKRGFSKRRGPQVSLFQKGGSSKRHNPHARLLHKRDFSRRHIRHVRFSAFTLPDQTLFPPYYAWPQPYARGPDMTGRIKGGKTVLQGSIWRSRIRGGKTVRQGSIWHSHIKGGRTVEGGSRWASHIVAGRTAKGGSKWRSTMSNWRFSGYAAPMRPKGIPYYRARRPARSPWASRLR